ncbi:unnamed protein product [marine sediment metagenome]|uniref:Uncharacterized protein n=1 Tax=marine sediment metagenome TaxID=412755 RepID=X0XLF7_9ZZZZ
MTLQPELPKDIDSDSYQGRLMLKGWGICYDQIKALASKPCPHVVVQSEPPRCALNNEVCVMGAGYNCRYLADMRRI